MVALILVGKFCCCRICMSNLSLNYLRGGDKMQKFILTDDLFIGEGIYKKAYRHPLDSKKCIKICYNADGRREQLKELKYRSLRKTPASVFPEYYGTIETSYGTGYVFEFIKNYDDSLCKSLLDYFSDEEMFKNNFDELVRLTLSFKSTLLQESIVTMKMTPNNLLVRHISEAESKIYIMDDIGSSALIPLEYYFDYFAKSRVRRKWKQFLETCNSWRPSETMDVFIKTIK